MPTLSAPPLPAGADTPTARRRSRADTGRLVLSRYDTDRGTRTVCARRGAQGSVLVLDEDAAMLDRRLVAHLHADEPAVNAAIAAGAYLADPHRRARALSDLDWILPPDADSPAPEVPLAAQLLAADGARYRLRETPRYGWRWTHRVSGSRTEGIVGLRGAVGALQDYEPALTLTRRALTAPGDHRRLTHELHALTHGSQELNRLLRHAVLSRVARGEQTLSAIALRCGRPNAPGAGTGDTAWLRRRIGDAPEAGQSRPTPWIGCALLARIARDGLGVDPREVELA